MQHTKSTIERGESMTNYDMDEIERQRDREKLAESIRGKKSDEQKNIYQDYKKLRMNKKNDRFDLEESIQSVWQTEEDLDTILYSIMDATDGPPSQDEIVNMLMGIKELHGARMQKLWDVFEDFVHNEHDTFWRHQTGNSEIENTRVHDYVGGGNSENIPHDAVSPEPKMKTVSTKEFMEALGQMDNGGDDNHKDEEWDATKFDNEDKELD